MTVHVACPVLVATLRLHLEKGRQWSVVEHIILVSIAQRPHSVSEIAERGRLPRRLVIESLIRLMRAGWVELIASNSGRVSFRSTAAGAHAAQGESLPRITRLISRRASFAVDKITGSVFRARELILYTKERLAKLKERDTVLELEPNFEMPKPSYDEIMGVVLDEDETYRRMDPSGARPVERFAVVTVRENEIDGLPESPPRSLVRAIQDRAQKEGLTKGAPHVPAQVLARSDHEASRITREVVFESRDLLFGGDAHLKGFEDILRRARTWIVVHSTFVQSQRFQEFIPLLNDAASRGARVDILWGQSTPLDGANRTEKEVALCKEMLQSELVRERVRLHGFSTNSHAKLVVADDGAGGWQAVIGSCNWLNTNFQALEVSARFRDPEIVADVAGQLAELAAGSAGHWTPLRADLAGLATNLRRHGRRLSGRKALVQLVLGAEHNSFMRRARDEAKERIIIASHRLGPKAMNLIIDPARAAAQAHDVEIALFYGLPSGIEPAAAGDMIRGAAIDGIRLRQIFDPRLHAKFLVWDDRCGVITSQNWLSADPGDGNPRSEIGVFIEASGLARQISDYAIASLKGI